jgi:phosphoglycerate dehydrogenase-like enzyme
MTGTFRVGLTRDLLAEGTSGLGDTGVDLLDGVAGLEWEYLPERVGTFTRDQFDAYDAIALLGGKVTPESIGPNPRVAVLARYGVGYDTIDIEACTRAGIAVTITPDGVRRPMATAIMTLILALATRLRAQDRLTRSGGWSRKIDVMGIGLTGRTLGLIGLGNIGREVVRLAAPWEMRVVAHDPWAIPGAVPDVDLVDLEYVFRIADFVVVACALTPETRHLVNADRLALMKPTAYLINTARGPIVDQVALTAALQAGTIAGAGLDVFEQEPVDPNDPLLSLDNVIVTPHALGWTDEWIRKTGESALGGILRLARGEVPPHIVNHDVLNVPAFRDKLARFGKT